MPNLVFSPTDGTLTLRNPHPRAIIRGYSPYSRILNTAAKPDLVTNNAAGPSNKIDPWQQLDRFLILGSEGGTYYVGEGKLTLDNAKNVKKLIEEDGVRVVKQCVRISESGRAPKNGPALFVLALAISFGDATTKRLVASELHKVARIGTHLFEFVGYATNMRGWGRTLRSAVANWYTRHGNN